MAATYEERLAEIGRARVTIIGPPGTIITVQGRQLIQEDAADLAGAAGVGVGWYCLARAAASEEGAGGSAAHLLGVASAIWRRAQRAEMRPDQLLLASSRGVAYAGSLGENAAGKFASTLRPPSERSMLAAWIAMTDPDYYRGADDFFSPSGQIAGSRQGTTVIRRSAEQAMLDAVAEGRDWIGAIYGVDAHHLLLLAPRPEPRTLGLDYLRGLTAATKPGDP